MAWMLIVFDSPASHPRISAEEKEYILDQLKSEIDIHVDRNVGNYVLLSDVKSVNLFIFLHYFTNKLPFISYWWIYFVIYA